MNCKLRRAFRGRGHRMRSDVRELVCSLEQSRDTVSFRNLAGSRPADSGDFRISTRLQLRIVGLTEPPFAPRC
jgi:hypothetical protein